MSNLERRLVLLEKAAPKGFEAFDANGKPVVQSDLSLLEWMVGVDKLFTSPGREAEKLELLRKIEAIQTMTDGIDWPEQDDVLMSKWMTAADRLFAGLKGIRRKACQTSTTALAKGR